MSSSEIRDCITMVWRIHGANMVSRGALGCLNAGGGSEACMCRSRIVQAPREGCTCVSR